MTIKEVFIDHILFSDDTMLVTTHEQECCEHTYADFEQLEDEAKSYSFDCISIERCEGGFRFGDRKRKFFVPCYSYQNGYYSNKIEVFILEKGVKYDAWQIYSDIYDDYNGELIERGIEYDN